MVLESICVCNLSFKVGQSLVCAAVGRLEDELNGLAFLVGLELEGDANLAVTRGCAASDVSTFERQWLVATSNVQGAVAHIDFATRSGTS